MRRPRLRRRAAAALAALVSVVAACAMFAGEAGAQTVTPVPKLSVDADIPNGFHLDVVDEGDPQSAVAYNTIGRLEIRAPAGTRLWADFGRNALNDGRLCLNEGRDVCLLQLSLFRIRGSGTLAATALVQRETFRFAPPQGQTRITVEARVWPASDPGGTGPYKSHTAEVEYRSTLEPDVRVLRYDFVRVNGAERRYQRDRIAIRLGWKSEHWDHRYITGFTVEGPAGSFLMRHEQTASGACAMGRALTDEAPGHECRFAAGSEARVFGRTANLLKNILYFAPPATGSGTARITITVDLLTGGTASDSLDIRYGPDVPVDLAHPYPVMEFQEHPLRLRTAPFTNDRVVNGDRIWYRVIVRDARDGSFPLIRPADSWEFGFFDWVDPDRDDARVRGIATGSSRRVPGRPAGELVTGGGSLRPDWLADWLDPGGTVERLRLDRPISYAHYAPAEGSGRLLGEVKLDAVRPPGGVDALQTFALYGPFRYGVPLPAAKGSAGDPVLVGDLPDDADQILGPGDEVAVRAALAATVIAPPDREVVTACIHTGSAAPPPAATWRHADAGAFPYCAYDDVLDGVESYLVITGPATWKDNGGKRLAIGAGSDYPVFHCGELDDDLGIRCDAKGADGGFPALVVDQDAAGEEIAISAKFASRASAGRAGFQVVWGEVGADWGSHAAVADRADEVFGQFSFVLRGIEQVHAATLERADASGPVAGGSIEALRLGIRNERGEPADASAISSITISASGGELDSDWCSAGRACVIDMAALRESAKGSERGPQLIRAIPLDLRLPVDAGRVEVTAAITSASRLITARLALDVRGAAQRLRLGQDLPIVHHHATPEDDDRDIAIIPARAFDALEQAAPLPSGGIREVLDPAGDPVGAGVVVTELCPVGRTACSYRVQVTAARADPIELGRYTLRISAGATSGSAGFLVVGPASGIEVMAAEPLGIWRTFEFRVRVTDEEGNPVADGTPVWWEARTRNPPGGPGAPAVVAITPLVESYTKTEGGEAAAEMLAVGDEIGILYAHAGGLREDTDASTLVVVDTGLPDQCTPRELSELQTGPEEGMVFATYNGRELCRASDLFASLDPSWGSLHLWNGVEWMPYAEAVPGMSDFMIQSGDLLCLIADQPAQAAMIR